MKRIPVCEPRLGPRERAEVLRALEAGRISAGERVMGFEERWAAFCGRRHGVALSSGTAALELALACLDLEPGCEVILPSFTIISCALAVLRAGAVPVFVDADPFTGTMDASKVEASLTRRSRALMAVHIYGHPCDMDPLLDLARRRRLTLIEDAAEAHGARYKGKPCGSFGEASCFSFYANKLIATGEGGMLLTDDPALAARARSLRNLAFGGKSKFRHEELGFNFRMSELQGALGLAQLGSLRGALAQKRRVHGLYRRALEGARGVRLLEERPWARSSFWMIGAVLDAPAEKVARRLAAEGIETRPFFLGLHEQPVLRRLGLTTRKGFPVTGRLSRRGLLLPSGTSLTEGEVRRVCGALRDALKG